MNASTLYVVDATVAVKWFLPETHSEHAHRWLQPDLRLTAPEVLIDQVGLVLCRRNRQGILDAETSQRVIRNLTRLPIDWVSDADLAPAALEVSATTTRAYAESLYLALAIRSETQVVTADQRWFQFAATGRLRPWVRFVSDLPSLQTVNNELLTVS